MNKMWIAALVGAALVGIVPGVVADGPYAYVAGECRGAGGQNGGAAAVGINEDGSVMLLDVGSGGVVDAASWFALQSASDGGQTGEACENRGTGSNGYQTRGDMDHLQVRAGDGGDLLVVVCYDGQATTSPDRCPSQA